MLVQNSYGKSRVRLVTVSRSGKQHSIRELTVAIALSGDFEAVHTKGDNRNCLPTDTMKNTVYALAKDHPLDTIESFALHLARHFIATTKPVHRAVVTIHETPWNRLALRGRPHPHTFTQGTAERQTCEVSLDRKSASLVSGIEGLVILKSADSAFAGYLKDRYTTLPETEDRIMATSLTARWTFEPPTATAADRIHFAACRDAARNALVETFATHKSRSVQHTLYAMAQAVLAQKACRYATSIRLTMPNKHCLLVDLSRFGMENRNEVFVPTDEPHGLIEAEVARG